MGYIVLNRDLGRIAGVRPVVDFGINQRERDLRHARRLALPRASEDHIFHPRTTQRLRRLLAEHPRDRVGNIRFAAAVRTNDRRNSFSVKLEIGAITEGFESKNLKPFQFEHFKYSLRTSVPECLCGADTLVRCP